MHKEGVRYVGMDDTEREYVKRHDENGNVVGETEYTYNRWNEKLISEVEYDKEGKVVSKIQYEYDIDGDFISKKAYNAAGEIEEIKYKTEFQYDEDGDEVSKWIYDEQGSLVSRTDYQYENDIGELMDDEDSELKKPLSSKNKTEYEYDKEGRVVTTTYYVYETPFSEVGIKTECTCYEYDEKGNLIKNIEKIFDRDGSLIKQKEMTASGVVEEKTCHSLDEIAEGITPTKPEITEVMEETVKVEEREETIKDVPDDE